jgi:hypothetical protein
MKLEISSTKVMDGGASKTGSSSLTIFQEEFQMPKNVI